MNEVNQSGDLGARQNGGHQKSFRRPVCRFALLAATTLVAGLAVAIAPAVTAAAAPSSLCPDATLPQFGPYVCVFTPAMAQSAVQADLDAISAQQVPISAQFDSTRYAIFFEPGTYGSVADSLVFQVGYYTEVAGLGAMPQETLINGLIESFANSPDQSWADSDDNFWRSLSNLDLNEVINSSVPYPPAYSPPVIDPYGPYCTDSEESWSVSQAAPIRRVLINGNVVLQDYCSGANDYASGGFIADSEVTGSLDLYGNQQFMVRNDDIGSAAGCGADNGGLWNNVFSGVESATPVTPEFGGQCDQNTVLPTSPTTEEEPFLYQGPAGQWDAFVPAVQDNTTGPAWSGGSPTSTTPSEPGTSVPLSDFFIANPSTPVPQIDAALALGEDLLFTPGIYNLSAPIVVSQPGTVVMGLGFATLVPENGTAALIATPSQGVKLTGFIVDAGPKYTPYEVTLGTPGQSASASDPDLVSDVFFRVGGAETTPVSVGVSFMDFADNSIIDDLWAWRADHAAASTGWTFNTGDSGVVVDADNVTAYGLAVEHYQQNEVVWAGNGGKVVFFQNELPYDVPTQSEWMETPTQDGYPALLVPDNVSTFQGWGMGSYSVFTNTASTIYEQESFEVPTTSGIQLSNTFDIYIAGTGGINSIVDGVGGAVNATSNPVLPNDLASFS